MNTSQRSESSVLPGLSAVEVEAGWYPIDANYIPVQRIANSIFLTILVGAIIAGVVFSLIAWIPFWMKASIAGAAFVAAVLLFVLLMWWPSIAWRHIRWRVGETGFEINRGVFWKHRIGIPWARVQHADVSQGPLERVFELGSLTIHTAGTQDASISLEGLRHADAMIVRDYVMAQREATDAL